jgi:hypothetical protein
MAGLDGIADIRRLQPEIVQLERIQPDAHGVLRAEHLDIADPGNPADRVLHMADDEVGDIDIVVAAADIIDRDDENEVRLGFGDSDALLLHFGGQDRHRLLQFVLDLDLGDVGIGAGIEGGGDGDGPGGGRGGGEIQQVIDAGELLFDHLRHGILQGLGIGAGIDGIDHHRRRRDHGILLDRQAEGGDAARQHDDNGDDPGEDRAVDEKARQHS